jgi:hypothetical protein
MKICPIAIVAGCARCPAVRVCPLKGALGDWKPQSVKPAVVARQPVASDKPAGRPVPPPAGKSARTPGTTPAKSARRRRRKGRG